MQMVMFEDASVPFPTSRRRRVSHVARSSCAKTARHAPTLESESLGSPHAQVHGFASCARAAICMFAAGLHIRFVKLRVPKHKQTSRCASRFGRAFERHAARVRPRDDARDCSKAPCLVLGTDSVGEHPQSLTLRAFDHCGIAAR